MDVLPCPAQGKPGSQDATMIDVITVLEASIEDYPALYELAWELNTIHPMLGLESSMRRAMWVTGMLLRSELVEAYWCEEPYGDIWPADMGQIGDDMLDRRFWVPVQSGKIGIRIGATTRGEDSYYDLNRRNIV